MKRNCGGARGREESLHFTLPSHSKPCGNARRQSQPSGNPALTDALSGTVEVPVLL